MAGLARLRPEPRCQPVRLRIGQADTPQSFRTPRPGLRTFEAFTSDAKERLRLTALSLVPRLRAIPSCRSRHAAPRGFPPPPARGLPPRRACARQPDNAAAQSTAAHSHCSDRLGSLHRDSVKARRQSRRQNQSHARRADATGTRSCPASPRALSFAVSEATGNPSFSIRRRDCTYAVQGLLAASCCVPP